MESLERLLKGFTSYLSTFLLKKARSIQVKLNLIESTLL